MPFEVKYVPSWFPGVTFKRKAMAWYKDSRAMLTVPYEMTKRKIVWLFSSSSLFTILQYRAARRHRALFYID